MTGSLCGCVYLPSELGCEMWRRFDRDAIAEDLARMRTHGLQAFRFFVIWRDFEPQPGEYDKQALAHLRELALLAAEHQLLCLPALLTIFVNGELLDLPWRQGRDLWSDAFMTARARAFAERAAEALAGCESVMAYDIGDELIHVDLAGCERLSRAAARRWQQTIAEAIRAGHPGVPVLQGSDASAVFGAQPFGVGNAGALDTLAVHTFPNWPPVALDGVRDPLSSLLPGFLVRFARAFKGAIVDELGAYGVSPTLAAGHLRTAGASALAAGAEALFAWCWQDIVSAAAPYDVRPHERTAGMLDAGGTPKPALAALHELIELRALLPSPLREQSPIGVLVPERWAQAPGSYLDARDPWARAALGAYILLTQEKLPVEFVHAPKRHTRLLICPGYARLSLREIELIKAHVDAGGHLWCSTWTPLALDALADLLGAEPVDFALAPEGREQLQGSDGPIDIDWEIRGHTEALPLWEIATAEQSASFAGGAPAICSRRHERGRTWLATLPLELQPLSALPKVRKRRWGGPYARAAAAAGIAPVADCAEQWLELLAVPQQAGEPRLLAINHACEPVSSLVGLPGGRRKRLELRGKSFGWAQPEQYDWPAVNGEGGLALATFAAGAPSAYAVGCRS